MDAPFGSSEARSPNPAMPEDLRLGPGRDASIAIVEAEANFDNWFGFYRLGPSGRITDPVLLDPEDYQQPFRLSDVYEPQSLAEGNGFGVFLVANGGSRNVPDPLDADVSFMHSRGAPNLHEAAAPLSLAGLDRNGSPAPIKGDIFHALAPERDGHFPANAGGNSQVIGEIQTTDSVVAVLSEFGEVDRYRFQSEPGAEYLIEMIGTGPDPLADPFLILTDFAGNGIAADDDSGVGLNAKLVHGGLAQILFIEADRADGGIGSYELQVSLTEDIPGDSSTEASLETPAAAELGVISAVGDSDWFRVELEAGTNYRLQLEGAASGVGTLDDPLLNLRDAAGEILASDDDSGNGREAQFEFLAPHAGTFFLDATAFADSLGSYRIVIDEAEPDIAGDRTTSAELTFEAAQTGTIEPGDDQDWFRVELEAGGEYRFDLRSQDQNGLRLDPIVELRDQDGILIDENDDATDASRDSRIDFIPEQSGLYYVVARSFNETQGSYSLSLTLVDDIPDGPETTATIAPGEQITGTVDVPGDRDWYRIELDPISRYRFDLTTDGDETIGLTDPFLELRDGFGDLIGGDDDGGDGLNARIDFRTEGNPGTYFIAAEGYEDTTGSYLLSAQELRNSARSFSSPGDKITEPSTSGSSAPLDQLVDPVPTIGDDLGSYRLAFEDVRLERGDRDFNDLILSFEPVDQPTATAALRSSFAGSTGLDRATSIPADPTIAVGTNHVVTAVNHRLQWHTKDGDLEGDLSLQTFFDELGASSPPFDPKVLYDAFADRFLVVAPERNGFDEELFDPSDDESRILLAVSDDGDPNGIWHRQVIEGLEVIEGENYWADFPAIAVGDEAIFITANMFLFDGAGFGGTRLWIGDKAGIYEGQDSAFNVYDPLTLIEGEAFVFTLQPTELMGATPSNADMYLASLSGTEDDALGQVVQVFAVRNSLSEDGPELALHRIPVGDLGITPEDSPQPETASSIDVGDQRALEAVWADEQLYVVNTSEPQIGDDRSQSTAFWFQLDTSSSEELKLVDLGAIGGNELGFAVRTSFPSIAVNDHGDVGIGFSSGGPDLFTGAYFTGRHADDPDGFTFDATTVTPGEAPIDFESADLANRWGDYSGTVTDPVDGSFWVFNLFAPKGDDPFDQWATTIANLKLPPVDAIA